MRSAKEKRALRLVGKLGLARPRDLERQGISRTYFTRLVENGMVVRQARGIYVAASLNTPPTRQDRDAAGPTAARRPPKTEKAGCFVAITSRPICGMDAIEY